MRFQRKEIIDHQIVSGSFDVNGNFTTTAVVTQTKVEDLILGDGSSVVSVPQPDGTTKSIKTIALPAAYDENAKMEGLINGASQVFLHVNVKALGAALLTGVTLLIEFNDPDHPEFWLPSKEGVARDTAVQATYEWACNPGTNSFFIVASRVEHFHFTKFRARFKRSSGAPDGATQIFVTWFPNGLQSFGAVQ